MNRLSSFASFFAILFIAFSFSNSVQAQTLPNSFQKLYAGDTAAKSPISLKALPDGGAIQAGLYGKNVGNDPVWKNFYLLRTDLNGAIVWGKVYLIGVDSTVISAVHPVDNGAGDFDFLLFGGYGYDLWVAKVDSDGDFLWQKKYPNLRWVDNANSDPTQDGFTATADGGFAVVTTLPPAVGQGMNLIRFDAAGNLLWGKTYNAGVTEYANTVATATIDGGFLAVGFRWELNCYALSVVRTDAAGDTLWTRQYKSTCNEKLWGLGAYEQPNGDFVILSQIYNAVGIGADLFAVKINSGGDAVTARRFSQADGCGFQSGRIGQTTQFPDGGFAVGQVLRCPASQIRNGVVLKLDSNLNLVWTKLVKDAAGLVSVTAVEALSDNGLLLGGGVSTNFQSFDLTLIRTGSDGQPLTGCALDQTNYSFQDVNLLPTYGVGVQTLNIVAEPTTFAPVNFGLTVSDKCLGTQTEGLPNFFQKVYAGDSAAKSPISLRILADGGAIQAGLYGQNIGNNPVWKDFYLMRTDANGAVVWSKIYPIGVDSTVISAVHPVGDDFLLFGGYGYDLWVAKVDGAGNFLWQKSYPGLRWVDTFNSDPTQDGFTATKDGGFAVVTTLPPDSSYGMNLIRFDGNGNLLWGKTYDAGVTEYANTVATATIDGGFLAVGFRWELNCYALSVVRTDAAGDTLWTRQYKSTCNEKLWGLGAYEYQGGFIILSQVYNAAGIGADLLAVKLSGSGDVVAAKRFSQADGCGFQTGRIGQIARFTNGSAAVAQVLRCPNKQTQDGVILKLDSDLNLLWSRLSSQDSTLILFTAAAALSDNGLLIGGSISKDFQAFDLALIRTNANGQPQTGCLLDSTGYNQQAVNLVVTSGVDVNSVYRASVNTAFSSAPLTFTGGGTGDEVCLGKLPIIIANFDSIVAPKDSSVILNLFANDYYTGINQLRIDQNDMPTLLPAYQGFGTLTYLGGGNVKFEPMPGFVGKVYFTYGVTDGIVFANPKGSGVVVMSDEVIINQNPNTVLLPCGNAQAFTVNISNLEAAKTYTIRQTFGNQFATITPANPNFTYSQNADGQHFTYFNITSVTSFTFDYVLQAGCSLGFDAVCAVFENGNTVALQTSPPQSIQVLSSNPTINPAGNTILQIGTATTRTFQICNNDATGAVVANNLRLKIELESEIQIGGQGGYKIAYNDFNGQPKTVTATSSIVEISDLGSISPNDCITLNESFTVNACSPSTNTATKYTLHDDCCDKPIKDYESRLSVNDAPVTIAFVPNEESGNLPYASKGVDFCETNVKTGKLVYRIQNKGNDKRNFSIWVPIANNYFNYDQHDIFVNGVQLIQSPSIGVSYSAPNTYHQFNLPLNSNLNGSWPLENIDGNFNDLGAGNEFYVEIRYNLLTAFPVSADPFTCNNRNLELTLPNIRINYTNACGNGQSAHYFVADNIQPVQPIEAAIEQNGAIVDGPPMVDDFKTQFSLNYEFSNYFVNYHKLNSNFIECDAPRLWLEFVLPVAPNGEIGFTIESVQYSQNCIANDDNLDLQSASVVGEKLFIDVTDKFPDLSPTNLGSSIDLHGCFQVNLKRKCPDYLCTDLRCQWLGCDVNDPVDCPLSVYGDGVTVTFNFKLWYGCELCTTASNPATPQAGFPLSCAPFSLKQKCNGPCEGIVGTNHQDDATYSATRTTAGWNYNNAEPFYQSPACTTDIHTAYKNSSIEMINPANNNRVYAGDQVNIRFEGTVAKEHPEDEFTDFGDLDRLYAVIEYQNTGLPQPTPPAIHELFDRLKGISGTFKFYNYNKDAPPNTTEIEINIPVANGGNANGDCEINFSNMNNEFSYDPILAGSNQVFIAVQNQANEKYAQENGVTYYYIPIPETCLTYLKSQFPSATHPNLKVQFDGNFFIADDAMGAGYHPVTLYFEIRARKSIWDTPNPDFQILIDQTVYRSCDGTKGSKLILLEPEAVTLPPVAVPEIKVGICGDVVDLPPLYRPYRSARALSTLPSGQNQEDFPGELRDFIHWDQVVYTLPAGVTYDVSSQPLFVVPNLADPILGQPLAQFPLADPDLSQAGQIIFNCFPVVDVLGTTEIQGAFLKGVKVKTTPDGGGCNPTTVAESITVSHYWHEKAYLDEADWAHKSDLNREIVRIKRDLPDLKIPTINNLDITISGPTDGFFEINVPIGNGGGGVNAPLVAAASNVWVSVTPQSGNTADILIDHVAVNSQQIPILLPTMSGGNLPINETVYFFPNAASGSACSALVAQDLGFASNEQKSARVRFKLKNCPSNGLIDVKFDVRVGWACDISGLPCNNSSAAELQTFFANKCSSATRTAILNRNPPTTSTPTFAVQTSLPLPSPLTVEAVCAKNGVLSTISVTGFTNNGSAIPNLRFKITLPEGIMPGTFHPTNGTFIQRAKFNPALPNNYNIGNLQFTPSNSNDGVWTIELSNSSGVFPNNSAFPALSFEFDLRISCDFSPGAEPFPMSLVYDDYCGKERILGSVHTVSPSFFLTPSNEITIDNVTIAPVYCGSAGNLQASFSGTPSAEDYLAVTIPEADLPYYTFTSTSLPTIANFDNPTTNADGSVSYLFPLSPNSNNVINVPFSISFLPLFVEDCKNLSWNVTHRRLETLSCVGACSILTGGISGNPISFQACASLAPLTLTSSANSVCLGGAVELTANTQGADAYEWQPSGLTDASVTVYPIETTIYTVKASASSNSCHSVIGEIMITVNSASIPVSASASPATICAGQSSTLTANGASTYSWSTGQTAASITVSPSATTTYTVTGTTNGCTGTATVTVTVNALLMPVVTGPTVVCPGSTIDLTGPAGFATYSWSPVGNAQTLMVSSAGTYVLTVTDASGCLGTSAPFVVTAGTTPTPTISGPSAFCTGQSITLSATAGFSTYAWSLSGAGQTLNVSAGGTYTVTVTDNDGCVGTSPAFVVTENALPTVTAFAVPATICAGQSSTLTANGASTYSWSTGQNGASITVSPATTQTFTVTGTAAANCSATATVTVTVNPSPSVSASATFTTICAGQSSTLTASGAATYLWEPGNLSGASVSISPTVTTTYTVTGTNANGCSATATVMVTVNPSPSVSATATFTTICAGQSSTLTASGANTYDWLPSTGLSGMTGTTVNASPFATTTYTVTGTDANGCSATSTVTVTVNNLPTIGATANPTAICSGASSVLTLTGGTSYQQSTDGVNFTTAVSPLTVTPMATTTYTIRGTDANGCTNTAEITVTVNALPMATLSTTSSNAICADDLVQFTVELTDGTSPFNFTLVVNNTTFAGNSFSQTYTGMTSLATISIDPNYGQNNFSVTNITDANGCTNTASFDFASIFVEAHSGLSVGAGNNSNTVDICNGNSHTLTAIGQGQFPLSFLWEPGGMTTQSITVSPSITTTYTVLETSINGCEATATGTVNVFNLAQPQIAINTQNPASIFCYRNRNFSVGNPGSYTSPVNVKWENNMSAETLQTSNINAIYQIVNSNPGTIISLTISEPGNPCKALKTDHTVLVLECETETITPNDIIICQSVNSSDLLLQLQGNFPNFFVNTQNPNILTLNNIGINQNIRLIINGNLTVNQYLTLNNVQLLFTSNHGITVNDGVTLTLNNTKLDAVCPAIQWRGIQTNLGRVNADIGLATTSRIRNAQVGIQLGNANTSTNLATLVNGSSLPLPRVNLRGTQFTNNQTGISLLNFTSTSTISPINLQNCTIQNSIWGVRARLLTGPVLIGQSATTANQFTNNVVAIWGESLNGALRVNNNIFTNCNVGVSSTNNFFFSPEVSVGTDATIYNKFNNCATAVSVNGASLVNIRFNQVSWTNIPNDNTLGFDIRNCGALNNNRGGALIRGNTINGVAMGINLQTSIRTDFTIDRNTIQNATTGLQALNNGQCSFMVGGDIPFGPRNIFTSNATSVLFQGNVGTAAMPSPITIRYNLFNAFTGSQLANGIRMQANNQTNIQIENNTMGDECVPSQPPTPIQTCTPPASNNTGIFLTQNANSTISIANNGIYRYRTGILVTSFAPVNRPLTIEDNGIWNVSLGVHLQSLNNAANGIFSYLQVKNNTIILEPNLPNGNLTLSDIAGILVDGTSGMTATNNYISGTWADNPNLQVQLARNMNGIAVRGNTSINFFYCNNLFSFNAAAPYNTRGLSRGFIVNGASSNNFLVANRFSNCVEGFVLGESSLSSGFIQNGSTLGEQRLIIDGVSRPLDNQWFPINGFWNTNITAQNPFPVKLAARNSANGGNNNTATNLAGNRFWIRGNANANTVYNSSNSVALIDPTDLNLIRFGFQNNAGGALFNCGNQPGFGSPGLRLGAPQMQAIVNGTSNLLALSAENSRIAQRSVISALLADPALRDSLPEFQTFFAAHQDQPIGRETRIELAIAQNNFELAASLNESLSKGCLHETCEKTVNQIYLTTFAMGIDTITAEQKAQLITIANYCPVKGGAAVMKARSLLTAIDDTVALYLDQNCVQSPTEGQMRLAKEKAANGYRNYQCYPNPTKGEITLAYELKTGETAVWEIFDLHGRLLRSAPLLEKETVRTLDLAELPKGVYISRVLANGRTVSAFRVVLTH